MREITDVEVMTRVTALGDKVTSLLTREPPMIAIPTLAVVLVYLTRISRKPDDVEGALEEFFDKVRDLHENGV